MNLPPELNFISGFFSNPNDKYSKATWLLSNFNEDKWSYSFGFKNPKIIDWNVELDDGSRLTDHKNIELLNGLKHFLILSTRSYTGFGDESNAVSAQANSFGEAIHIIDHLLLNASHYELGKHGLAGLSGNDLKNILATISASPDSAESIYSWTNRLRTFCFQTLDSCDSKSIDKALIHIPELSVITPTQEDENTLDVPVSEIPRIRAALYLNDLYRKTRTCFAPNSVTISKILYRNTLKGRNEDKPTLTILNFGKVGAEFIREYPPVPVTTGNRSTMTASSFNNYRLRLYDFGTLHEMGLPAPAIDDLTQIMEFQPNLSPGGRFRTLPSELVFKSFRHAVELHIEHGKHIVDGFCRLAIRSKSLGIPLSSLNNSEVINHVGSALQKIGVRQLGLSCRNTGATAYKAPIKGKKNDYFSKLRSNTALNELMAVYIGGVQLVVGALMARRVGELKDLPASGCLDESEEWLVFDNRKSSRGLFGSRSKEARPIEQIAVKMIKNLIRMQKILKRIGYIKEMTYLFSSPSLRGDTALSLPSMHAYNRNLDLFCDYFQTDLNSKGQRYYIRQHQLRRFFALLFFHSSSFGGLETLQWMLGHTDIKHVWNYITESIDGATLRGAKAQYIAECLHRGGTDIYDNLAKLLKRRYGTDNFALVDTNELEDHISELMDEGTLEVEPDFFHDERGEHLRVIVKVKSIT